MSDVSGDSAAERLVAQLREQGLVDSVVAVAREVSPPIAQLPQQEITDRTRAVLRAFLGAFPDETRIEEAAQAAERTGADRARQGVPLLALLESWQGGRSQVFEELAASVPALGMPVEEVLAALVVVDARTTVLQHRMIQAYRLTELELARTQQATRAQTLRDLVSGRGHAGLTDAGLDPADLYHCVLADVTATRDARRLEPLIAGPHGLGGLVDGYLCCVTTHLPPAARVGGVLMIVSPAVPVTQLTTVYRLCRKALSAARARGYAGSHHLEDLVPEIAVDDQTEVGPLLVGALLGGLDPTDEFHRLLASTAVAFLGSGGRVEETARSLHVHTNTIKHRLRRLGELTGYHHSATHPMTLSAQVQWWWALQHWLLTHPSGRA